MDINYISVSFRNLLLCLWMTIMLNSCHFSKESKNKDKVTTIEADEMKNRILKLKSNDTFSVYLNDLKELDNYLVDNQLQDSLYSLAPLYNVVPKNQEDSLALRVQLTRHAQQFNKINDYKEALKFYLLASGFVKDLRTDKYVWNIENRIGAIYARMGDYDKTLYYYKLCIPYLSENVDYGTLSRLYKEIGRTYMWLGDYDDMKKYYDEGISYGVLGKEYRGLQAIHEAYGDYFLNYSTEENNLGNAYKHIQDSGSYLDGLEMDEDHIDREQSLDVLLGQYYNGTGEYDLSAYHYCKALHNAEIIYTSPKSREIAKIYHKLAQLSLLKQNLSESNDYIKKGINKLIKGFDKKELPEMNEIDRENTFIDLLNVKADYYHTLFDQSQNILLLDSALIALEVAIKANDQLNKKLLLNNSKYLSVATNKSLVNKAITYCFEGFEIDPSGKYADKARKYFDLSKSIIFLENQTRNSIRTMMSEDDKMKYDGISEKLLSLIDNLDENEETKNIELEITGQSRLLSDLESKYQAQKVDMMPISKSYIEYVETDVDYYMLTNIGNHRFYRLGDRKTINSKIFVINKLLQKKESDSLFANLDTLCRWVLPLELENIPKLTIIPDGQLAYLPFDILRKDGKYLFESYIISQVFHYHQPVYKEDKKSDPSMYVLNPDYKKPEIPEYASLDRSSLTYLPYAEEEVNNIRTYFTDNDSLQQIVDFETLKEKVKKADIFHFAGHAIVKSDSAFLALTDAGQNVVPVFDNDIYRMTNHLDLVTLSACETGLGDFKYGEGVKSLATGFLHSGSKSIVYSLWKADDQSTADVMGSFYKHLYNGETKDKALHQAKKDFLMTSSPEQRHPYYWAAFVVAGDTSPIFGRGINSIYYWAAGLMLLFGLYLFFQNKTKNV